MDYKNWNWRLIGAVVGMLVAFILLLVTVVPMAYRNTIADNERAVEAAMQTCAIKIDNGVKAITGLAEVDISTKQFLNTLFENAAKNPNSELNRDADAAYVEFVQTGNIQPMMLLMSTLAGTDITATSTAVQREISAQRSEMTACSVGLVRSQNNLKNSLGWNAANQTVKFPQTWMDLQPSNLPNPSLPDNDNDGRITVLDYVPPVNASTLNSFNTGGNIDVPNPYNNTPYP